MDEQREHTFATTCSTGPSHGRAAHSSHSRRTFVDPHRHLRLKHWSWQNGGLSRALCHHAHGGASPGAGAHHGHLHGSEQWAMSNGLMDQRCNLPLWALQTRKAHAQNLPPLSTDPPHT